MPGFEVAPGDGVPFAVGEYGTYFRFPQKDLLPRLSPRVRNYFAYMFKQGEADRARQTEAEALRPNWLRYLEGPPDEALLERQGDRPRNMWCTAGFLHAAGLSVAVDGRIRGRGGVLSLFVRSRPGQLRRRRQDGMVTRSPLPGPLPLPHPRCRALSGGDDGGARRASRLSTLRASFSGLREFLHDLALFRASSMFTDGPDTSISARHG